MKVCEAGKVQLAGDDVMGEIQVSESSTFVDLRRDRSSNGVMREVEVCELRKKVKAIE